MTSERDLVSTWEPGRRGEILGAALEVFGEKGYRAGSMRDIAGRVGVSEPALYRHFAGKEALFRALVRVVASHLRDEAFGLLDALTADGLRGQISAALADRRRAVAVFAPVLRTLFTAAAHDAEVLSLIRDEVVMPARDRLLVKVTQLDAAFGMASDGADREARVRAFLSLFVGSLVTSAVIGDQPDEAMAEAVVRLMGWDGKA